MDSCLRMADRHASDDVDHRLHDGVHPLTEAGDERPYSDEELATLREVVFPLAAGSDWRGAVEGQLPEPAGSMWFGVLDSYADGDLDRVLDVVHPEVVIEQPQIFPDARGYFGRRGMVEALLDWPLQWEHLTIEPKRLFGEVGEDGDQHVFAVATHRGLSKLAGVEVEAEIVWLFTYRDGLLTRWTMHMSVDDARAEAISPRG